MTHIHKFAIGVGFLGISLAAAGQSYTSVYGPNVLRAHAIILGAPGSGISGFVTFTEAPVDKNTPVTMVEVVAVVKGLPPGKHGMHIHQVGSCADTATTTFGAAGGHFDPGPFGNSNPDANHPFHMGDLPNLEANRVGVATLQYTTSRITLSPGPLSVFDSDGSAVIIHQNEDLGGPGPTGTAGGGRIACGVIN